MRLLLPLLLLTIGAAPADHPRSYLLSIERIPLTAKASESIMAFSITTWGVQFRSVCHIPAGWRIKAGNSASPDGEIEGGGSQGVTWFQRGSPKELKGLALVTLHAPVQREDIGLPDNVIPATFKGTVTISTDDGDVRRELNYKNVTLVPARRCPSL
ncbi:hypothetical protein [Novosphingobium humi]|uniref:hypothetical protein n=1 Tax=Novosphingobium humi TaxID=2282397 RepID=UPI0025AF26B9|nr:hypothetical protein [Novosphingobium humi]WJT00797.1 hypothetical protein NYQ05_16920 [Novosphingobium humi]